MFLKENNVNAYLKADKLLLIGDYFNYIFTGKRIIDYALASRTGVFDIHRKKFSKEILDKLGMDYKLFSTPQELGAEDGEIKEEISKELNLPKDTKVILGSHDQVCATIGAGVLNKGESADGMGTVECVTTVFDKIPDNVKAGYNGYPTIPFIKGL